MFRKILFTVTILLFIGGLTYLYYHVKEIKQPVSKAITAIPGSAAVILRTHNTQSVWSKLSTTNLMWEELMSTKYVSGINANIKFLDSLLNQNEGFNKLLAEQPLFVSLHMSGANKFDYLFSISIPYHIDGNEIIAVLDKFETNREVKDYDDATIVSVVIGDSKLHYSFINGVFLASFSNILIEEAIRQLKSPHGLLTNYAFQKVFQTSGKKIDGNFYVNYKHFPNLFRTFLKEEYKASLNGLQDLANWSELDLKVRPNTLILNGFTYSSDSINNYLNVFSNQKPQQIEVIKVLPFNTALLIHFGFSDFNQFKHDYIKYLEKGNKLFEYGIALKKINSSVVSDDKKDGFNIEDKFFSWVENEIAIAICEPVNKELEPFTYAIFKSKNIELAKQSLNEVCLLIDSTGNVEEVQEFKGFAVKQIKLPELLPRLFGSQFSLISQNYYTLIEDYVIFSNSFSSLKTLINNYLTDRTMSKDLNFISYSDNISSESNIFIYSNIARSTNIYKAYTNKDYEKEIEKNTALYRKFEAISIQISKDHEEMLYNNIFLKYNPIYKEETRSLWETKLKASVSSKPYLATNHYTGTKEIFVQDDDLNIYLIDNKGKILWSKKLDQRIIGKVQQIDIYRNGKLQLIFNTQDNIYILDRNGKNVDHYPVKLEKSAIAGLTLMDYDNNRNYRILVSCEGGKIYNYGISGVKIKGWDFEGNGANIFSEIKHFNVKGKDYITFIDISGRINIVDRRGKTRLEFEEIVIWHKHKNFYIDKGKDLDHTYLIVTDRVGNVIKLSYTGKKENLKFQEFSETHMFLYKDLDGDMNKEFIFVDETELKVFNQDKSLIFDFSFDDIITDKPMVFNFGNNNISIGIVNRKANEIYMFNKMGALRKNFPLSGFTTFSIGDINKDKMFNLVVGSDDKNIYTYTLEK